MTISQRLLAKGLRLEPRRNRPRILEGAVCVLFSGVALTFAARTFLWTFFELPNIPNIEMGIIGGLLIGFVLLAASSVLALIFFFTAIGLIFGARWSAFLGFMLAALVVLLLGEGSLSSDNLIVFLIGAVIAVCCVLAALATVIRSIDETPQAADGGWSIRWVVFRFHGTRD